MTRYERFCEWANTCLCYILFPIGAVVLGYVTIVIPLIVE